MSEETRKKRGTVSPHLSINTPSNLPVGREGQDRRTIFLHPRRSIIPYDLDGKRKKGEEWYSRKVPYSLHSKILPGDPPIKRARHDHTKGKKGPTYLHLLRHIRRGSKPIRSSDNDIHRGQRLRTTEKESKGEKEKRRGK